MIPYLLLYNNLYIVLGNLRDNQLTENTILCELLSEYKMLRHLNLQGLVGSVMNDLAFEKLGKLYYLETLDVSECPNVLQNLGFLNDLYSYMY